MAALLRRHDCDFSKHYVEIYRAKSMRAYKTRGLHVGLLKGRGHRLNGREVLLTCEEGIRKSGTTTSVSSAEGLYYYRASQAAGRAPSRGRH